MGEREKEFRQRIARIARIQNLQEMQEKYQSEEITTQNNLNEISPVINGIKKNIENFRTKQVEEIEL
ncbi:MAG: hypothetical protein HFJ42_07120 [Clostridia bacterium]|nr:hypothetical protein [Clostridia bacterium]